MNFSDKKYCSGLRGILEGKLESNHSIGDCFYQLISGVPMNTLENLISMMISNSKLLGYSSLSKTECYAILIDKNTPELIKRTILDFTYTLLDNNYSLGNSINEYGCNRCSWITHSLEEARLCSLIAKKIGLDEEKAFKMGLMHDYGRKYIQNFSHVIIGFEKMFDNGYYTEALACLTHSFLNGDIFSCFGDNEKYQVNESLEPIIIDDNFATSDLYLFLKNYTFTDYDRILNLADLMATDSKIVSPEDRIADIERRRKLEIHHREYFIIRLQNMIKWLLLKLNKEYSQDNFHDLSIEIYHQLIDDDFSKVKKYYNCSLF